MRRRIRRIRSSRHFPSNIFRSRALRRTKLSDDRVAYPGAGIVDTSIVQMGFCDLQFRREETVSHQTFVITMSTRAENSPEECGASTEEARLVALTDV